MWYPRLTKKDVTIKLIDESKGEKIQNYILKRRLYEIEEATDQEVIKQRIYKYMNEIIDTSINHMLDIYAAHLNFTGYLRAYVELGLLDESSKNRYLWELGRALYAKYPVEYQKLEQFNSQKKEE